MNPFKFENNVLYVLDQRKLPHTVDYIEIKNYQEGARAITDMLVRGAPAIGFFALYSMVLWAKFDHIEKKNFDQALLLMRSARPTAVNLNCELDKVYSLFYSRDSWEKNQLVDELLKLAQQQVSLSQTRHQAMADLMVEECEHKFSSKKLNILTHCNTGRLACGSLGTALGAISVLHSLGKVAHVYVDETRPYLQGSRLTAFELLQENISHSIVVEGCASYLMKNKMVDLVMVGADRIALNGDTANKIGTSNLSILAHYYQIPFYVLAPESTFDRTLKTGEEIHIELRDESEIKQNISPIQSKAFNPSFDVSEGALITGIVSELKIYRKGIAS